MVRSVSPTDLGQKAFVRGLSEDIDEDGIRRVFSKFGEVITVHIAKDRDTGSPLGYAFITYNSSTDCGKACTAMDGKEFHGRVLQVELASRSSKKGRPRGGGGFRGSRGMSSFRSHMSPPRDSSYRRGSGSLRGSWRGGRGEYRNYGSRGSDTFHSTADRFRRSPERDLPPRDYGSRYESGYDYRPARPERDYPGPRDYPTYRSRDYPPAGDRDFGPPRDRDYPSYYSPPRDYPPGGRDYPSSRGRSYPLSRSDSDFDVVPRRYASRDYDDYPSGNGFYESRAPRRDYGSPPRDYGAVSRYDSYEGRGRADYKSRGSFSGRGSRVMDSSRGMPSRRGVRDDDRAPLRGRRPMRSPDGPAPKKMKMGDPMRRSSRGTSRY